MLSWKDIQEMDEKYVSFGSHTITHPILTNLEENQMKKEIFESKLEIETKLGKKIDLFCYPNGDFNEQVKINSLHIIDCLHRRRK